MAMDIRIQCIVKSNRYSPHEAIERIGGQNPNGAQWSLTQQEAIARIEDGTYSFYVERQYGHRVKVVLSRSALGNKYIKTEADGDRPDNLLSLPSCP